MTSTENTTNTYPKPPYDDCDEVWHIFDAPMDAHCAYRAMERDGRVFKDITHKVDGLKYIYWHPERNGIEMWHKKDDVCAWASAVQYLEERFVYACLRSKGRSNDTDEGSTSSGDDETRITSASEDSDYDIVTNNEEKADDTRMDASLDAGMDTGELTTQTQPQIAWAQNRLNGFKAGAKFKMLFDIPDFTGFAPQWHLSPTLMTAMDSVLTTYHMGKGETILYDKRSCGLIWLRRDCSSYEIRTNNHYALQYAQQFIVHQLFTILTTWHLAPNTIPPNSALWVNVYNNIQHHRKLQRQHHRQNRKNHRKHNKHGKPNKAPRNFQARKNKKRQMTSAMED